MALKYLEMNECLTPSHQEGVRAFPRSSRDRDVTALMECSKQPSPHLGRDERASCLSLVLPPELYPVPMCRQDQLFNIQSLMQMDLEPFVKKLTRVLRWLQ